MIWGEEVPEEVNAKNEFLMGQLTMPECHTGQAKIKVYSGVEWMVREVYSQCCGASLPHRGSSNMGGVGEDKERD